MASIQSRQVYKLINAVSGTSADVSGGDNRSLIGFSYHGGTNQHWFVEQVEGGWTFRALGSGQYLAVDGAAEDWQPVIARREPFVWNVWPDENDPSTFRLFVPNTSHNVDLSDHGNCADGTKIHLWGKWEGQNQTWRIEPVSPVS